MMRYGLIGIGLLLVAQPSAAQSIQQYELAIYLQGGVTPVTVATVAASAFTCGQPRVAVTGTQINPSRVRIADPANATLDCVYIDPGTGPLLALPFNPTAVYEGALRAVNAAGSSPESGRSNPFTRPGTVPSAPTGLRIGG